MELVRAQNEYNEEVKKLKYEVCKWKCISLYCFYMLLSVGLAYLERMSQMKNDCVVQVRLV